MTSHQDVRGHQVPDHLRRVAARLQRLFSQEHVREHCRAKVRAWCEQRTAGVGADGAPAVRCANECIPVPAELDEAERCALLVAVYDLVYEKQLGPSGQGHPDTLAVPYIVLKLAMEQASEEDAARLLELAGELERAWRCVHSDDFCSVVWFGQEYRFSRSQAACVRILWRHWEQATPDVYGNELVKAAAVDPRGERPLGEVFRVSGGKMHPAWRVMVVPGVYRGSYQLRPPPTVALGTGKPRGRTRGSSRPNVKKPSGKKGAG